MTTPPNKPKRWWPRFSVRALVVVVTLVCAYLTCWQPTERRGVKDVETHIRLRGKAPLTTPKQVCPLIVRAVEVTTPFYGNLGHSHYYFWFFGYVAKLPHEREVKPYEMKPLEGFGSLSDVTDALDDDPGYVTVEEMGDY